jgi:hypothetical protein
LQTVSASSASVTANALLAPIAATAPASHTLSFAILRAMFPSLLLIGQADNSMQDVPAVNRRG